MPDKGSVVALHQGDKKNMLRVEVNVRECAIRSVVVFKDRAEVKRAVAVELAAGENEVLIGGLAECVDKNSIRYDPLSQAGVAFPKLLQEIKSGNPLADLHTVNHN